MGYFLDHGRLLAPEERLQFRPGEVPPPFDPAVAPEPPSDRWPAERLAKARRNYAMEYLRTGLPLLFSTFGVAEGLHLGRTACWLIGVQLAREVASTAGVEGTGAAACAGLIAALAEGEGDAAEIDGTEVRRRGLRLWRGLGPQPPEMFTAWNALHEGLVAGIDRHTRLELIDHAEDWVVWRVT